MVQKKIVEMTVGLFMIAALLSLLLLGLKVSGLSQGRASEYYRLVAEFDNIGSLKERAPVRIAGVKIGQIEKIELQNQHFKAKVTLLINKHENNLPTDTSANILTEGLLGSNYVGLTPGFEEVALKNGDVINNTHPALILENLIGQLLFSMKNKD
ncbi:MAG: outer membrane lipid asymmetry maintenance protein MlaD [Gammaproteobacteria bacterium]|nr:outer membrane lipid asymmetry maintenance protein MlaD [Gammaproteobacteria bacterium]